MPKTPQAGPTLRNVAEVAGVSRQTVSNVLNAPERVASSTRVRVQRAIDELSYRPNRNARSLRTRASRLVGYCVQPSPQGTLNPVLDRFIHAVTESAAEHGFHLLLFTAPAGADGLPRYAELRAQQAVDAFVLADTVVDDPRPRWLAERDIPFVAFGRTWTDGSGGQSGPWVDVDGADGVRQAVEHVHALGHRRIAFIGWPAGSGVGDDRLAGYDTACRSLGVAPRVVRAAGSIEAGAALAGELLDGADPPTALVCVSDLAALGALRAVTERGLRPGRDIALVGFDDTPAAALPGIDLTSVGQPIEEVGRAVVELLLGSSQTGHRLLRPTLTVRSSTRPEASS